MATNKVRKNRICIWPAALLVAILLAPIHDARSVTDLNLPKLASNEDEVPTVTYPITGHMARVGVTVKMTGTNTAQTITNATGDFSFSAEAGGTYTITPIGTRYLTFAPASTTFTNLSSAQSANFLTIISAPRYTNFDFDLDGYADVSLFRPSNRTWYLDASTTGFSALQFGAEGDIIAPGDFLSTYQTDLSVFRPSDGTWYVWATEQNYFFSRKFGVSGDIPVAADYDGDTHTDLAVYRPSNGYWYIWGSTVGFIDTRFGIAEDLPAPADYDGDGRADICVFRPSTGVWYRLNSFNGNFVAAKFGQAGDKVVPADYDGDSFADIAVWRPSDGTWYILSSANNAFRAIRFGVSGDLPSPADYDGDWVVDPAVFRPSTGAWYELRSASGFVAVQFGTNGDKPAANAYVY